MTMEFAQFYVLAILAMALIVGGTGWLVIILWESRQPEFRRQSDTGTHQAKDIYTQYEIK